MKQSVLTTILSVVCSALVAVVVVKASAPKATAASPTTTYSIDGSAYRTVNLSETDYPDFTYAAESAVDAVVFVKVTVKTTQQDIHRFCLPLKGSKVPSPLLCCLGGHQGAIRVPFPFPS